MLNKKLKCNENINTEHLFEREKQTKTLTR